MNKFFVIILALIGMSNIAHAEVYITIDKSQQVMYVDSPEGSYAWPVSTARNGYKTPVGDFKPYRMARMHYSKKYDNAPMPHSIFFLGGYAIHATDAVGRLGSPASHGCVRLAPQNARWLYNIVRENGMEDTFIRIVQ